jgi:hypothetical protein
MKQFIRPNHSELMIGERGYYLSYARGARCVQYERYPQSWSNMMMQLRLATVMGLHRWSRCLCAHHMCVFTESEWPYSYNDIFFDQDESEPNNHELNLTDNQKDISNKRIPIPEGAILIEDDRTQSLHTCTDQEKGYVRLLTFIEQHCLPLYVYDDLLDFMKCISYTWFDFSAIHPKRQTMLKKLSARFVCPEHEVVLVPMETNSIPDPNQLLDNNESVHVLRFDVRRQIKDVLASEIFHDMNNLVVDPSDPFGMYKSPDGRIGELYSGDWYRRTYKDLITNPSKEMLIGVKLYCDKTGTDSMMMRHGLEPVMFTLTIIKKERMYLFYVLLLNMSN